MTLTRITSDGITDSTIATADLADQSVTLAKLPHGTSSNDGKFLRANNGADPTFESVVTDLVNDSSPQLGGDLASNGNDILMADSDRIKLGTGNDLIIDHNGSDSFVKHVNTSGHMRVAGDSLKLMSNAGDENYLVATKDGAVELYFDNTLRFLTNSIGAQCQGDFSIPLDNEQLRIGASNDLRLHHDGTNSIIANNTGTLFIAGDIISLTNAAVSETYIKGTANGAVELYYDNTKRFEQLQLGLNYRGSFY
ncbi:hypothetical protein [uncultured phage MedDCM-OCT-S08-C239]|nr:hypothetical protein [uncultured phage MedDCM-OCT-S08-C239]